MVPSLGASLNTNTWGRPYRPSSCKGDKKNVKNIISLAVNENDTWTSSGDHSKYCYTPDDKVVCVGDLNH